MHTAFTVADNGCRCAACGMPSQPNIQELECLLDALSWMDRARLAAENEPRCGTFAAKRLDLLGDAIHAEKEAVLERIRFYEPDSQFDAIDRLEVLIREALNGGDYDEVQALVE